MVEDAETNGVGRVDRCRTTHSASTYNSHDVENSKRKPALLTLREFFERSGGSNNVGKFTTHLVSNQSNLVAGAQQTRSPRFQNSPKQ